MLDSEVPWVPSAGDDETLECSRGLGGVEGWVGELGGEGRGDGGGDLRGEGGVGGGGERLGGMVDLLGFVGERSSIRFGNLRQPATRFLRGKSLAN